MKSSGSNSSSNGNGNGETKMERKTIEKQRRMQMKSLSLRLASLIPKSRLSNSPSDSATQLDNLEEAASYIINLRNRIQELKDRKEAVTKFGKTNYGSNLNVASTDNKSSFKLPIIEVRYQIPNLEVVLIINTTSHNLTFHKLIRIIEEEGVDVVNASHSTLGDKVVYTIHSQVRNPSSGLQASRISNRLKDWIQMQNI